MKERRKQEVEQGRRKRKCEGRREEVMGEEKDKGRGEREKDEVRGRDDVQHLNTCSEHSER